MTAQTSVLCLVALLGVSGCSKNQARMSSRRVVAQLAAAHEEGEPGRRYLAVKHSVAIETREGEVPRASRLIEDFCRAPRCEITAASLRSETGNTRQSGSINLRVVPDDIKKLFDQLARAGTITQHSTQSEDKTDTVIDVEARIKNLTDFRDSLRGMLGKPSATLKDLVEVQKELTNVQSELDGLAMKRKVLAAETEKVGVDITLQEKALLTGRNVFAPIAVAWRDAGLAFSESMGALITAVAAVIPWALLMVPVFWLARSVRRWRRNRANLPISTS